VKLFALAGSPDGLRRQSEARLAFADAVHEFVAHPGPMVGSDSLALWKEQRNGLRAIILSPTALNRLAGTDSGKPIQFRLIPAGAEKVGGSTERQSVQTPSRLGSGWRVEGWFAGTPAEMAAFEGRRKWYRLMLSGLLLVLIGGSAVLWRLIRKQVAVNQMKSEFVATVSHEFRSPLHAITHLVDLLRGAR
jgi:signal transduction histidine kinase